MKNTSLISTALVLFSVGFSAKAQDGQTIFTTKCVACHTIGNGRLVGPDLKGVTAKYPSSYFVKWIKSSQSIINSGDAKAKALFLEYNSIVMPDFPDLKEPEIKAIVAYIKSQSGGQVAAKQTGQTAKTKNP